MIPLPNLDDQRYEEILEAALRRIPVLFPLWTDLNPHDPGITLLELFAWLKEMQQYQLNRITDAGQASLLKLLGVLPLGAESALARLALPQIGQLRIEQPRIGQLRVEQPQPELERLPGGTRLPVGMRFEAQGGLPFESTEPVLLYGDGLTAAVVSDGKEFRNVLDNLREPDIYFHPFGAKPVPGESAFYLGFERLAADFPLRLHVRVEDRYPVHRNPIAAQEAVPEDVVWEVGVAGAEGIAFEPAAIVRDGTFAFARTGLVRLMTGMEPAVFSPAEGLPVCRWIRVRLLRPGCEENPRIMSVDIDTVQVSQRRTHCRISRFHVPTGSAPMNEAAMSDAPMNETAMRDAPMNEAIELRDWLCLEGRHSVFVRTREGWRLHDSFREQRRTGTDGEFLEMVLEQLPAELIGHPDGNVLVIACEPGFADAMQLGGSDGLPGQRFDLPADGWVLASALTVLVREETEEGLPVWTEWRCVPSLTGVGPHDNCFSYDSATSEIVFGDNLQGAVPTAGEDNLLLAELAVTAGETGNLPVRPFTAEVPEGNGFTAAGLQASAGGRNPETVQDAMERAKAMLNRCTRAVTAADWEKLASMTPGLRVGGVRALPGFDADLNQGGESFVPATVTVVITPFGARPCPVPDAAFLEAVRRHLEAYRLVTTRVKVMGPVYVPISVHVEILAEGGSLPDADAAVRRALEDYFSGVRGETTGQRPSFGEPVRESILTVCTADVPGVARVKRVTLGVRHPDCRRDRYGTIVLPPYGLPSLGDLQVRVLQ